MQDSKNLKRKIDVVYPKLIKEAEASGDTHKAEFWKNELERIKHKLENRLKNRKRNEKQYNKAN